MSLENFRAETMTMFRNTFDKRADVRVSYENGPKVDFDTSTVPVIHMDTIYTSAEQRDIADNPWITDSGVLMFSIFVKENTNNLVATKLMQEVKKNFQVRNLGGARLYEASAGGPTALKKGWVTYRVTVKFELDSLLY